MADNLAVSGGTCATDDVGGIQFQRVKACWGVDGTGTDTTATTPFPTVVVATSITSNGPTSVTAAITDTLILAANTARRGCAMTNDSTATLKVSLGTNAASATAFTVLIAAAGYYEVPFGYSGQIRGIWSAANGSVRITEVVA